jgi:hypothetical protein
MTRIAHNHHQYSNVLDQRVKHSYRIYLDYLKFLQVHTGLLVNSTMIVLFACQRLEQHSNEGATLTTINHGQKA